MKKNVIQLRVSDESKLTYEAAALQSSMTLSEWLRYLADKASGSIKAYGDIPEESIKPPAADLTAGKVISHKAGCACLMCKGAK